MSETGVGHPAEVIEIAQAQMVERDSKAYAGYVDILNKMIRGEITPDGARALSVDEPTVKEPPEAATEPKPLLLGPDNTVEIPDGATAFSLPLSPTFKPHQRGEAAAGAVPQYGLPPLRVAIDGENKLMMVYNLSSDEAQHALRRLAELPDEELAGERLGFTIDERGKSFVAVNIITSPVLAASENTEQGDGGLDKLKHDFEEMAKLIDILDKVIEKLKSFGDREEEARAWIADNGEEVNDRVSIDWWDAQYSAFAKAGLVTDEQKNEAIENIRNIRKALADLGFPLKPEGAPNEDDGELGGHKDIFKALEKDIDAYIEAYDKDPEVRLASKELVNGELNDYQSVLESIKRLMALTEEFGELNHADPGPVDVWIKAHEHEVNQLADIARWGAALTKFIERGETTDEGKADLVEDIRVIRRELEALGFPLKPEGSPREDDISKEREHAIEMVPEDLVVFAHKGELESRESYEESMRAATEIMRNESGVVEIRKDVPTVVIPDIHGRRELLVDALTTMFEGKYLVDHLRAGTMNLVCLGDGMHSEQPSAWLDQHWVERPGNEEYEPDCKTYYEVEQETRTRLCEKMGLDPNLEIPPDRLPEFQAAFRDDPQVAEAWKIYEPSYKKIQTQMLHEEMIKSLGVMKLVMDLKADFPANFFFIRGNHDDIRGKIKGDFKKYSDESKDFRAAIQAVYGAEFVDQFAEFEDQMPLMVVGAGFVASHAVPEAPVAMDDAKQKSLDAARLLTWTRNVKKSDEVLQPGIEGTLTNLGLPNDTKFIIGHSVVNDGLYRSQLGGQLIQINNRYAEVIAVLPAEGKGAIDPGAQVFRRGYADELWKSATSEMRAFGFDTEDESTESDESVREILENVDSGALAEKPVEQLLSDLDRLLGNAQEISRSSAENEGLQSELAVLRNFQNELGPYLDYLMEAPYQESKNKWRERSLYELDYSLYWLFDPHDYPNIPEHEHVVSILTELQKKRQEQLRQYGINRIEGIVGKTKPVPHYLEQVSAFDYLDPRTADMLHLDLIEYDGKQWVRTDDEKLDGTFCMVPAGQGRYQVGPIMEPEDIVGEAESRDDYSEALFYKYVKSDTHPPLWDVRMGDKSTVTSVKSESDQEHEPVDDEAAEIAQYMKEGGEFIADHPIIVEGKPGSGFYSHETDEGKGLLIALGMLHEKLEQLDPALLQIEDAIGSAMYRVIQYQAEALAVLKANGAAEQHKAIDHLSSLLNEAAEAIRFIYRAQTNGEPPAISPEEVTEAPAGDSEVEPEVASTPAPPELPPAVNVPKPPARRGEGAKTWSPRDKQ